MDKQIDKIWTYVMHGQNISMEIRLFRLISLIVPLLCLLFIIPVNMFQDLSPHINQALALYGILGLYLYNKSCRGRHYIKTLYMLTMLLLNSLWFLNGGSDGSIGYFFFAAILYPLIFFHGGIRLFMFLLLVLDNSALLMVEHYYPLFVIPFNSENDRLIDLISGFSFAAVASALAFWAMSTTLERELADRKQAKEALLALKDKLQAQNEELRVNEKTMHEKNDELLATEEMLRVQINDYKTSQKLLQDSKEHYRAIVDAFDGQIYICSQEYQIEYLNEKMIERIGLNAVGERCFKALHDLDEVCSWCVNDRVMKGEKVQWEVQSPKDKRWYYVINTPIYNENGTISKQAMIHDITDRKKSEEERTNLENQLHQAQKMESVGRLAGGVAHDFNNLLTVIHGYSQLGLMESEPGQAIHDFLTTIQNAAKKSADLTQQLLTFARKQTIAPIVLDLNETVKGMLKMLQRLIGENVNLIWQSDEKLWQVKMDPSQIDQILANLCVNARDSIADVGNITIKTGNTVIDMESCIAPTDFEPGDYVKLSVSDDGCGMDGETKAHIFEPFFTTKDIGKGTGLGLATVYGIVKQNSGFIDVLSESGQGTTFTIYLPRYMGGAEQEIPESADKLTPRGQETILLVEDESDILKMTTLYLTGQGYQVLQANTPDEAIQMASDNIGDIHLLITDVIMPKMNGRDLANNLQQRHPHLECLFMSGYTADLISHHGVLQDDVYFIQKPFSLPDLAAKVRAALDNLLKGDLLLNRFFLHSDIRLLVAEDNPFNIKLIKTMLDMTEHSESMFVTTGSEALEACKMRHYDLILMDCNMPEMDGFEATRRIRIFEGTNSRPPIHRPSIIIAMTGDYTSDNQELCRAAGMDDFLPKPFTIQQFIKILQRWLPGKYETNTPMTNQTEEIKTDGPPGAIDWSLLDALKVLQKPGKPDIRKTLISTYLTSIPTIMANTRTAVSQSDGNALRNAAHSMKSSSMAIGAILFGKTCAELEQLGKSGTLEEAPALITRAEYELAVTCSALREAVAIAA
jgi:PAS domain S-box-containing protein